MVLGAAFLSAFS